MKFRIMFLAAAMIVAGMSAVVAKADGLNDPLVRMNKGGDATDYDGTAPLTEAFTAQGFTMSFLYDGSGPLDALTFVLTSVPFNEGFQCFSDVWVECKFGVTGLDSNNDGLLTYTFLFDDLYNGGTAGTGGPCQNNTPAGGTCPGFLSPGDTFTATVDTPEPSSMLLLVGGLVPLFGFGRKRWGVNRMNRMAA